MNGQSRHADNDMVAHVGHGLVAQGQFGSAEDDKADFWGSCAEAPGN